MAARRFSKTGAIARAARTSGRAAPKAKGEPGAALGGVFVLLGILLLAGGACAFLFAGDIPAPREGMLLGGALAGVLGIASLTFYFHKWGNL